MHEFHFAHRHELQEGDFEACCKDCQQSLEIIRPHITGFAKKIKGYSRERLSALSPQTLYRRYQVLDDLAHMDTGEHLARLILNDPEIHRVLPTIRSYYSLFFGIHEAHLAEQIIGSDDPWKTLQSFALYPRYEALIRGQVEARPHDPDRRLLFIGCGPVPTSLILLNRFYGIRSLGLDSSAETVALSKKVIRRLGLDKEIAIEQGDDFDIDGLDWNLALVAALAEPKRRIFSNIKNALAARRDPAPVIYRTYTGMRAVLYDPVRPEDVQGFHTVKEIFPTGRVNNTTVYVELDQ